MSEIEEVKARLDIVDVIGQSVQLHKAGRTFKAVCPFHAEKTPSFVVNPDRQTWHCFGACGTGGDVISFVMKREGIEFGEALRMLAERAGVKLKERRVSEEQDRARQRLYEANEAASAYFQRQLTTDAGKPAREYVERRRIDEETARAFGLGYSPSGWQGLLDHLRGLRFSDREIVGAGLAVQGDNGSLHDRFRNRLMFPVWDAKGRMIGFGARALDPEALPKYLNTAQTPLFDKSGTLYALNKAGEAIKREGRAIVVEGYMDVIAAHQHGFTNVVAQMGTALTERQVRLLKRLTGQIVLALDADAAGTLASARGDDVIRQSLSGEGVTQTINWRGIVTYLDSTGIDLRAAVVPHGKDPDDFIREDPEAWRTLIDEARPVLDFRLDVAATAHDLSDPRGRSQLVQEYLPLLGAVADPVVRAHYLTRLSRLAQVSEEELTTMVVRPAGRGPEAPRAAGAMRAGKPDPREGFLLALLVQYPQLREAGLEVPEGLLWDAEARQVYEIWRQSDEDAIKEALPIELMDYFERLIIWKLPLSSEKEAAEALQDCVQKLNQRRLQAEKQAIAAQIADLQEQMGPSSLGGEPGDGHAVADERGTPRQFSDTDQLQQLLQRDMEIGWELHRRDRKEGHLTVEDGRETVETVLDG